MLSSLTAACKPLPSVAAHALAYRAFSDDGLSADPAFVSCEQARLSPNSRQPQLASARGLAGQYQQCAAGFQGRCGLDGAHRYEIDTIRNTPFDSVLLACRDAVGWMVWWHYWYATLQARNEQDVLLVHHANLIANPFKELGRVATYLGLCTDDALLKKVGMGGLSCFCPTWWPQIHQLQAAALSFPGS